MQNSPGTIIKTDNLSFGFARQNRVLNNLNLRVESGTIYGFLGQNGAGKTTTIRLLLGLLKSTDNNIQLFGRDINKAPIDIFKKVGAFIESPSLYEHLTGYDNLSITSLLRDIPQKRIAEVLHIVNLSKASNIKVKNYSLGMKQRLALALALLSEPPLLILDEPTNGLDANGINEIRELLLQLNRDYGTTIFISSHLLSEIEKMVTHLGIVHQGNLIFQGTIEALLQQHQEKPYLIIETSDNTKAAAVLQNLYLVNFNAKGKLNVTIDNAGEAHAINKALMENEINVLQLQLLNVNLEKIYLELTKN